MNTRSRNRGRPGLAVAAICTLMFALGADTAVFNRKPTPAPRAAGTL